MAAAGSLRTETFGLDGNDYLTDGPAADILHGGNGDDVLYSRVGSDTLDGGAGNDYLEVDRYYGEPASQLTLTGGAGDDRFYVYMGGSGSVALDAGDGNDFVEVSVYQASSTITLGAGSDVLLVDGVGTGFPVIVTDFQAGDGGDRLEWSGIFESGFYGTPAGNPFSSGWASLTQSGADVVLSVDGDGPGFYDTLQPAVIFRNTSLAALTAWNLGGVNPNGTVSAASVSGTDGADLLFGTAGADTISAGGGDDRVYAGLGDDVITAGDGADYVDAGLGTNQVDGGPGNDHLYGGDNDDSLSGGDGNDYLDGGEGGNDTLDGGEGNDTLIIVPFTTNTLHLSGGAGDDRVVVSWPEKGATVYADLGDGNDRLDISGNYGSVVATLGSGSDTIWTGNGSSSTGSTFTGTFVVTDFQTGDGGDVVDLQNLFKYNLTGWNQSVNPFGTQARLVQSGADTLLQIDKVAGQGSWRTVITFQNTDAASFTLYNLHGVSADGSAAPGLTLTGTASSEAIYGTVGPDTINGLDGSDLLNGNGGDDTINGGNGSDTIDGGAGDDVISGGSGNDSINVASGGGADIVNGDDGNDTITSAGVGAHLFGGVGNDKITDTGGAAEVDGGDGDDTLAATLPAGAQPLDLRGGTGNDVVTIASSGAPTVHVDGGAGDDTISIASRGTSVVTLGDGSDTVSIDLAWNAGVAPAITILDFAAGADGDRLSLTHLLKLSATTWNGSDPYAGGYLRIVQSGSDAVVQMDADGSAGTGGFVTVATLSNVDASALTKENLGFGTTNADTFMLGHGHSGAWSGFGGDDIFYFGAGFTARSSVDGGAGADTVILQGDYASGLLLGAASLAGVETLSLLGAADASYGGSGAGPFSYALQLADGATSGQPLLVDAHGLAAGESLSFDGADETVASFHVIGGTGADDLVGGKANDILDGGAGADTMAGGAGNDIYYVDDAGDQVAEAAGGGTDEVDTALASYTLADGVENLRGISDAGQALTGNAADNVVAGRTGADSLAGGDGNDTLVGNGGGDSLAGGAGDDSIYATTRPGSGDTVVVDGGAGTDRLLLDMGAAGPGLLSSIVKQPDGSYSGWFSDGAGETVTFSGIENFTLYGTDAGEHLVGADGKDFLAGFGGDDLLEGGLGDDLFDGGVGNDTMIGGPGNDFYFVNEAGDVVVEQPNEGTDQIQTPLAAYTAPDNVEIVNGSAASGQALTGNALANTLYGYDGNDILDGGAGADHMAGGKGNDVYIVDNAGDVLLEQPGEGTDEVRTALASYTLPTNFEFLTGTSNAGQALTGNSSNNTIRGGDGNDLIDGGGSGDTMIGGKGDDVYVVDTPFDQVVEAAGEGTDEVRTALVSYSLAANVEKLTGLSSGAQRLTGNALDNVITGGAGNDTLVGGDGNDVLDGRGGADTMTGGKGDDIYYVGSTTDQVIENNFEGTDEVRTTLASYTLAAAVENVTGLLSTGQTLTGNGLDNVIRGGAGADHMAGGAGNDVYYVDNIGDVVTENVGDGVDEVRSSVTSYALGANVENLTGLLSTGQTLTGNGLGNVLTGFIGNDVLDGGTGADAMAGGKGDDIYYVDNAADVVIENAGEGYDEVRTTLANYVLPANVEKLTYVGAGNFTYTGGGGNDDVAGNSGNDFFDLSQGGADKASGGGGNDAFAFGAAFGAGDVVDGGGGTDTIGISGDYTGANKLSIAAGQLSGVETLAMLPGAGGAAGYDIAWADGNLAAGQKMIIFAGNLQAGENLSFDGSAETHGFFVMYGGLGTEDLKGGSGSDGFYFGPGKFTQADHVDGGGGAQNQLGLDGSYDFSVGSALGTLGGNFSNIQTIALFAGDPRDASSPFPNTYHIVTNDAAVAAGKLLTIFGTPVISNFVFDGSAESDGAFRIFAGTGDDILTGGHGNDMLYGNLGADTMTGGAGNDIFLYTDTAQSTAAKTDHIMDFDAGDHIDLSQIDADTTQSGDQAFAFIGSDAFGHHAGELRAEFDQANGVWTVQGDTDGDGNADFTLLVTTVNNHALVNTDFVP